MNLVMHRDNSTQSDFENGAIDIVSSSVGESFELGTVFGALVTNGFDVVKSVNDDRVTLRVPLKRE